MSHCISSEKAALLKNCSIKQYGPDNPVVESDGNRRDNVIRIPITFSASDLSYSKPNDSLSESENNIDWSASLCRYRYYLRLGVTLIPDHVLPPQCFVVLPQLAAQLAVPSQGSFVTIFAIWNTMMGTSLLSMPFAIQQSGFALGIFLMLFIAGLTFYSAYLVLKSTEKLPLEPGRTAFNSDFSDACRIYLGRTGEIISIVFSFLALLSGLVVFYVLLCNFSYLTVHFIYDYFTNQMSVASVSISNRTYSDAVCPSMPWIDIHNASKLPSHYSKIANLMLSQSSSKPFADSMFNKLWSQTLTVPFWCLLIILPLISIKSPTFFTKFNALGTISVVYLLCLVILKVFKWGIHMDFSATDYPFVIPNARSSFTALTGIASLAFFIHNALHSIMRNQAEPKNNTRDLFIAYVCVAFTYLGIGILFYIAYPFAKDCIQDNLLNNLSKNDLLAFVGRIALFFQILTVLPLLVYILRSQFMYFFFKRFYPSWLHVFILHIFLLGICVIFAVFIPRIGEIIRFSGALCGLVYVFALPALVKIQRMRLEANLSVLSLLCHISLIVIGLLNFLGQFASFFN